MVPCWDDASERFCGDAFGSDRLVSLSEGIGRVVTTCVTALEKNFSSRWKIPVSTTVLEPIKHGEYIQPRVL